MTYLSEEDGDVIATGWDVIAEWWDVGGRHIQLVKRDHPGSSHVTVAKRIVTDDDHLYAELTECRSFNTPITDSPDGQTQTRGANADTQAERPHEDHIKEHTDESK